MSTIMGIELSPEMMELINSEHVHGVAASLTQEDNFPHTTPIHLMKAINPRTIRLALAKGHQIAKNVQNNGKLMLSIMEAGDVAISIKGMAKVIRDPMEGNPAMMAVEMDIIEVKSDTTPTVRVEEGVKTSHRSEKTAKFFRAMFDELTRIP